MKGLVLVLVSLGAWAQQLEPVDAGVQLFPQTVPQPVAEPGWVPHREGRFNVLLPILEAEALHFAVAGMNNLLLRESFAQISLDSELAHFDGRVPWWFDVDSFAINQFGHPYQGALAFTAARSSGLSFWWACIYPIMASLTWELFFEVDGPSWNDQITTPLGGIFLGEVLHRSAMLVLKEGRGPRWLRALGSFLIEPVGHANRLMFDETLDAEDIDDQPPVFFMVGAGANLGTAYRDPNTFQIVQNFAPQGNLQGRLTYGMPGDPRFKYRAPFSHFDVDFNLSVPGVAVWSLFMRGLLAGTQFSSGKTRGLWGVFGQYDFASASLVRVSSVGFGVGMALQTRLPADFTLQLSTVLSAVPYASAGALGLVEGIERDYHIGPGGQFTVEARLIWADRAWLRVVGRSWFIAGLYIAPPGWESVSYVTAGPQVRVWGPISLGADVIVAVRRAKFDDDLFDRSVNAVTGRLTLNWVPSETLGVVVR